MLEFFRRYEKVLFIIITTVIVISFSFFGTYSAFTQNEGSDSVAFVTLGGTKVYQSEIHDVETLLRGDFFDDLIGGGGTCFNDGAVTKDILENGIALPLMLSYVDLLKSDLSLRLQKEKRYQPYVNPNASFINTEQVWSYFAPDIKYHYNLLKASNDATSKEALENRIKLYLAERRFPAPYLKQMLKFQEKEYQFLPKDETLLYQDLSLFGYHNIQDWFGENFLKLTSEFIINCAQVAKKAGYEVSREEASQSLIKNAEKSFQERSRSSSFPYAQFDEYYNRELQRLGMDEGRLIKAWTSILLFRRYFQEHADSILVSPLPFEEFSHHVNKYADLEVYELPQELNFKNLESAEKFEIYLKAISDPTTKLVNGFLPIPPEKVLVASEVKKSYPELVEREFHLKYAVVDKKQLASRVGVKKTWEWEAEEGNFKKLSAEFPDIAHAKVETQDERMAILDKVDPTTRHRIDAFARNLIINDHPEWVEETLDTIPMKDEVVYLRERGGEFPFLGIQNRQELINLLTMPITDLNKPKLFCYTQDNQHYYRIEMVEPPKDDVIITFKSALEDGTLDTLFDKALQSYLIRMNLEKPQLFMKDGKKPDFNDIKDKVEDVYFQEYRTSLSRLLEKEKDSFSYPSQGKPSEATIASLRLVPYLKEVKSTLINQPELAVKFLNNEETSKSSQFKLDQKKERIVTKKEDSSVQAKDALKIEKDGWSRLIYSDGAGLYFYKVLDKGEESYQPYLKDKVYQEKEILGQELKKTLAENILIQMKAKNTIDLALSTENKVVKQQ